jgi:hypothetical protein
MEEIAAPQLDITAEDGKNPTTYGPENVRMGVISRRNITSMKIIYPLVMSK